jgi:hypothetical protein
MLGGQGSLRYPQPRGIESLRAIDLILIAVARRGAPSIPRANDSGQG